MTITDLEIPELKLIQLKTFKDERGFFVERFNKSQFAKHNLPTEFSQDNHSYSHPGVLRGLHFQVNPFQGKIVSVIRGQILDVAVDIRPESKTFLKHISVKLCSDNNQLLFIPGGFAHGFCVIGDEPADVTYKVDVAYDFKSEMGIKWDDKMLGIQWPAENPIVSEKDSKLMSVKAFIEWTEK